MNDGYTDHPKANKNCQLCKGGGLLDDGDLCAIMVACPCTGEATPEIIAKIKNNPELTRRLECKS